MGADVFPKWAGLVTIKFATGVTNAILRRPRYAALNKDEIYFASWKDSAALSPLCAKHISSMRLRVSSCLCVKRVADLATKGASLVTVKYATGVTNANLRRPRYAALNKDEGAKKSRHNRNGPFQYWIRKLFLHRSNQIICLLHVIIVFTFSG